MIKYLKIDNFIINENKILKDAFIHIDNKRRTLIITDNNSIFKGILTDSDLRKAILNNYSLDSKLKEIIKNKNNITVNTNTSENNIISLFKKHNIKNIPILNNNKVVKLAIYTIKENKPEAAIIMAGGKGTRLYPLTKDTPKPLLKIGERVILEWIILSLSLHGVKEIYLMLRQHGKQIENYFKKNNFDGIKFNFIYEKEIKGTAGALSLIKKLKYDNYIIMNGDIISTINYTNLLKNHLKNNAEFTVAVKRKNIEIPYGVLQLNKNKVDNIQEKPTRYYYINSGIYIVDKKVIKKVPKTGQYSMVDLMHRLLKENVQINSFPLHEYWLDVGEHHNFEKAQKDIEKLF